MTLFCTGLPPQRPAVGVFLLFWGIFRSGAAQTITEFPIPTADSSPSGITAGPDGNLWFTEQAGNKIGRISTAGAIAEFAIPTANSFPVDITAGPDGTLWFLEHSANQIGRITPGPIGEGSCTPGTNNLCLNNGRFRVEVNWRVPSQGTSGAGIAVGLTGDTGSFWFFSSANVELAVKVVDGRAFNNKYWVFYGALSNVEYTIRVTDTVTGSVKTYFNASGHMGSVADTTAF